MWNEPSDEQLQKLPGYREQESKNPLNTIIYEHFFMGGCDWYASGYDPENRAFFGYAILNGDYQMTEWGYLSFDELREFNIRGFQVDKYLYFEPRKTGEIES